MVTKWHLPTQAKLVCTQMRGISVTPTRQTPWEDLKSTGIDFWGQHLKIIVKHLMIVVLHPYVNTMRQPL
jgi:hypothetical protein